MPDDTNNPVESTGGKGEILADPHRLSSDLNLVRRAARQRWPISDETRRILHERMTEIVETKELTIIDGDGDEHVVSNARNQTAAGKVLVVMESQNQADDHLTDKNDRLDAGKPTENIQGVRIIVPGINSNSEEQKP